MYTGDRYPRLAEKTTIINIRGTNGSGKSTVMTKMMKKFGSTPLIGQDGKVWAYQVHFEPEFYILGRYDTPTGGCDVISTMNEVEAGIRRLANKGHVLFEGIIISTLAGRWVKLAESMPNAKFIFATLDTALETCIAQVKKRRKETGNNKPFDPKNLIAKYRAVKGAHKNLKKAGLDVRRISHELPTNVVINYLLEDANKDIENED